MEKKKVINYILGGLLVLTIAFFGVTFAFWNITLKQEEENIVKSVCLKVTLEKDENEINLPKAIPISDEEGLALKPYKFSIQNTCQENASYQINLESLSKINNETEITDDKKLDPKYVRFKLNEKEKEGTMLLLSNTDVVTPILDNTYSSHKLMTGYLSPSETKEFELRLWLDKDADEGSISKTFASKVTITNAYLEEDKIPPTANLDLAVCDTTITATGSGQASTGKRIIKYEYKIDDEEWQSKTTTAATNFTATNFTAKNYGLHKISLRVTDNTNNVSGEVIKEVEIKEPETVNIKGAEIPIATCGDGLYKVEHKEEDVDTNWKGTEYRFAGVNYTNANTSYVHNYVKFNEEIWLIIGLVNVKTEEGKYEQRLKIVRTDGITNQTNFGSYPWDSEYSNDWTKSSLKKLLNGEYYSNTQTESGTLPKGLNETAQGMVDDGVTWNLGGTANYNTTTVTQYYNYERGETVYNGRPKEWTKANDGSNHKGVGLIYPSDYGYATNGGTSGRDYCFEKELYNWNGSGYKEECANKDWLKPSSSYLWTLTPDSGYSNGAFIVFSTGCVRNSRNVGVSYVVWPVVYLKSNIQISGGEGTVETPYELSV